MKEVWRESGRKILRSAFGKKPYPFPVGRNRKKQNSGVALHNMNYARPPQGGCSAAVRPKGLGRTVSIVNHNALSRARKIGKGRKNMTTSAQWIRV